VSVMLTRKNIGCERSDILYSATPDENLLTVKDLSRILNCGRTKAWELVNTHQIRTVRVGRLVRLEPKAIEEFIESNRR
jgi:excisionase family DNA binding protein